VEDDIKILDIKMKLFNTKYKCYEKANKIDDLELKEILCDVLSWFEICLKKIDITDDKDKSIISAIRYANNMKKHSKSIFSYTLKTFALYPSNHLYPSPILFPSIFSIYWNKLPLDNLKYKGQYNNYKNILEGKDIYSSINDIYQIIKKYFKN
jgi:hypothetical protein